MKYLNSHRSVHNTRVERMWVEVTHTFGESWKDFFFELEDLYGLRPDIDKHLWLLHFLFLDLINQHAQQFQEAWNHHVMELEGRHNASPRELWLFGQVEHGVRGLDDFDSLDGTGVGDNNEEHEEHVINALAMADFRSENSYAEGYRGRMNHVAVPSSDSPFSQEEINRLDAAVPQLDLLLSWEERAEVWCGALLAAKQIFDDRCFAV
ncbi:hypothetical protein BOTBODRAFT_114525 [Botryobasidium botryosum FD-172 SS1]|uniref:Integrase core domain-containing protein n=1 Tax=Botryobasidium botryosum (strain FD-172 SS1) TaxID=930990 RepID=A0A067M9B9_BOTB1|nr:hypothetical protein BOTBODRAFT_114525 [Botryobasidium botryosum FD-172 SS1]